MVRPVDLADSPVRRARVAIQKTIAEAAEQSGVNWQTWFLTENGCYEEIPGRIMDYLGRINIGADEYFYYRRSKQRKFGLTHGLDTIELPAVDLTKSPIELFRGKLAISRTDFAKSFAVQTAHLYNCEHGRCKFLPNGLREAFEVAGLSKEKIDELDARQEEFYEYQKAP